MIADSVYLANAASTVAAENVDRTQDAPLLRLYKSNPVAMPSIRGEYKQTSRLLFTQVGSEALMCKRGTL